MGDDPRPTITRWLSGCAVAAGLLAGLASIACQDGDSLATIRQQQAGGDLAGTLEPLREHLAQHPDDAEANYLYGRALALTEQGHLATWSLRKAMEDPRWRVAAGLQLAFLALSAYDFNEVEKISTLVLEQEPENTSALLMRANAHAHWRKDPERALADADRVLQLDPEKLEAYEPRILALLALGREAEAREALAEAGLRLADRGAPEQVLAWHCTTTAVFQSQGGEPDAARETWDRCLEEHPANVEVVADVVSFHDAQGNRERSLEIVRAAHDADPASRSLRNSLAERLRLAGELAEAEAILREATESQDPALAAAAWADLAKFRQGLGEYTAAAEALGRAVELARKIGAINPQLAFEYADALVLAGRLDRALEEAEELEIEALRHLIRARVAQERREPARALEEFDAGLRLWPDNPWARYQAATAAQELGDFERALEEFRYSIRISPGATDARTRAARQLYAEGRPRQALEVLRTAGALVPVDLEGQLLTVRVSALLGDMMAVRTTLERLHAAHPVWAARALREAAEGLARRSGPRVAMGMLGTAPGIDYRQPEYAEALRAFVRFAHAAGEAAAADALLDAALEHRPDSSAFVAIRGLHLELSGVPAESVREAYARAVELGPRNAHALAGLARLMVSDDPQAAVGLFDRAAAADPSDPAWGLDAARARAAAGDPDRAARQLDALLLEHPCEANLAVERARLDLARGVATLRTLERAQRAVRFRGGVEALEMLSQVHRARNETDQAAEAAERARVLRAAQRAES